MHIDTVVCLTLVKWETVSGRFGGYLSATVDVGRSFANGRVALGVRACPCAVTVNAALTMQRLDPATYDPNVRENDIGVTDV